LIHWWDSNLQSDRLSARIQLSFVDFIAFSLAFDRVRCASARSSLERNWSVRHLVVGLNERQPYPNAVASGERRACRSATQLRPAELPEWLTVGPPCSRAIFTEGPLLADIVDLVAAFFRALHFQGHGLFFEVLS
jgi:hypothetical protein